MWLRVALEMAKRGIPLMPINTDPCMGGIMPDELRGREPANDERPTVQYDRATVRAVLDLLSIEGYGFKSKPSNGTGWIEAVLHTDGGDTFAKYAGEERTAAFVGGTIRGTGYYRANDALVDFVMREISRR